MPRLQRTSVTRSRSARVRLARLGAIASVPLAGIAGLVFAAAAGPIACSSSPATGAPIHDAGPNTTNPVARFVLGSGTTPPNYLDVPFPSDAYIANGKVVSAIPAIENFIENDWNYINYGLSKLNGFSRLALAVFAVDKPSGVDAGVFPSAKIDPRTLPVAESDCLKDGSAVYLLDLTAGAAQPLLPCRADFHDDTPHGHTNPVIAVGPPRGVLLQEAHQYAAVLTSRLQDMAGNPVIASADFTAVTTGDAPGPIGAAYTKAYLVVKDLLANALLTDRATIVSIAPFTTMKMSQELFAMRDTLEAAPAPTLTWDSASMAPMAAVKFAAGGATPPIADAGAADSGGSDGGTADAGGPTNVPAGFAASLDDWLGVVPASAKLPDGTDDPDTNLPVRAHDQIAAVGTAVFQAVSYLQVKPQSYADQDHATFAYDMNGLPTPQSTKVPIWVTFVIPKSPMPSTGYPTVIVQHGLSGSREYILDLANTFAKKGWLVAGIDSVTFGARAPEAMYTTDTGNEWGGTYKGPDGFADQENGSTDLFGGLQNILAIRDQFRQAGFDTAQLVKVLRSNPDLSALDTGSGAPKIDATKIAYIGDSLGAMEGTIAAALEPNVQAWYLNVNAGSIFPDLAAHSPAIGKLLVLAAGVNFHITGDTFNWSHPLLQVLQNIMEPGDPITYAQYLTTSPQLLAGTATKPRNAVQVEVIWDYFVTDEASEAIARAAGWDLATPNVGSNADITDPTNATPNLRATPFVTVDPDMNGAIHDTPAKGVTAVLIQTGPAEHGRDLVSSTGEVDFAVPFVPPFQQFKAPVSFPQDYRGLQNVAVTFFGDAFQGQVPRVMGFAAPKREVLDGGF
jgi:dienelactone hydrolase